VTRSPGPARQDRAAPEQSGRERRTGTWNAA
jgi:hypothetical protein